MKNITTAQHIRRISMIGLGTAAMTFLVGCSVGGGSLTLSEGAMGASAQHSVTGSMYDLTDGVAAGAWTSGTGAAASPVGHAPSGDLIDGTPSQIEDAQIRGGGVIGGQPHADLTD